MFDGEFIINEEGQEVLAYHVELSDVKSQLNLLDEEVDQDPLITRKIESAHFGALDDTGHHFAKTSVKYDVYNLDRKEMLFQLSPYLDTESIRISEDGLIWTELVEFEDYMILKRDSYFKVIFSTQLNAAFAKFDFLVGYEVDECPSNAKEAIVLKAADSIDIERASYAAQKVLMLHTYERLINGYVKVRFNDSE